MDTASVLLIDEYHALNAAHVIGRVLPEPHHALFKKTRPLNGERGRTPILIRLSLKTCQYCRLFRTTLHCKTYSL
jgi:hypothetical protein